MRDKIYFLSDFHLGAAYLKDEKEAERRIVRFLDSIKDSAEEIYLMGDILDYWYEYRYVVPKGFVRFFGKLAELSDSGIKIHWFIGNHDIWIYNYLPSELGINVIDGIEIKEIKGKCFFLNHGDAVGKRKLSFRFIRSMFRNKACQFLYSMLPSCLTIPFAHRWSSHSRANGNNEHKEYISNLNNFAKEHLSTQPDINYYIFGHLHCISDEQISETSRCIILGDWIDKFTYAVFDGNNMQIEKYSERNH